LVHVVLIKAIKLPVLSITRKNNSPTVSCSI